MLVHYAIRILAVCSFALAEVIGARGALDVMNVMIKVLFICINLFKISTRVKCYFLFVLKYYRISPYTYVLRVYVKRGIYIYMLLSV